MRLFFLTLFFFFALLFAHAQAPAIEWQKCYGGGEGDYAHSITPTSDGGYIIAGYTESTQGDVTASKGTIDFWIVKINSTGAIQWQKNFGGKSWDKASVIYQTNDGGYIVGGSASSIEGDVTGKTGYNMDFWVLKLSAAGAIEWQKVFGGDKTEYLNDLKITADGYILAGSSESVNGDVTKNNGLRDFWVVKISKTGIIQWQKVYGGALDDEAKGVEPTSDGGYIVTGLTESSDGDVSGNHGRRDIWTLKLDGNGNMQWKKCLGGSLFEEANAVRQTPDGGYLIVGKAGSNDGDVAGNHVTVAPGFTDFWAVKLNSNGTIQWQKCYGGGFNEIAYTLDLTTDGGFLIAGSSESANGDVTCNKGWIDYWVVKTSSSGVLQWQKSMGAASAEEIYSVKQTPDGGTILAGFTGSNTIPGYHPNLGSTGGDYWIIKLTAQLFSETNPSVTISIPSTDICAGSPYTFTAQAIASETPVYKWEVNGMTVGTNSPTYNATSIRSGDLVKCIITVLTNCGTVSRQAESNTITMQGGQDIAPEVTTVATATTICSGTSITFTATNKSGHPNPAYQWSVNGQNVGTNSTSYTTNSLTDGAIIVCRMTVPQCAGGSTKDDSDPIVVKVKPVLNPSIQIETANTTVCKNTPVVFSAKTMDSGSNPSYQWQVNGIIAGTNGPNFSISNLNEGDEVSCRLGIDLNASCSNAAFFNSNIIKMKVVEEKPATINISASANNVCEGTSIQFLAQVENAGTDAIFHWQVNGIEKGKNDLAFTTSGLANGDRVSCILNTKANCAANNSFSSNVIVMNIRNVPRITVIPTDTVVGAGTQLQLKAKIEGNVLSYQWEPQNYFVNTSLQPLTIPLEKDVKLKLTATAADGCTSEKLVNIVVSYGLFMPNSFSPNDDGRNDLFRIPPQTSLKLKRFCIFDRWGNEVFATSDITKGWDGKYKGQLIPGVYVYIISGMESNKEVLLKGTVVLMK